MGTMKPLKHMPWVILFLLFAVGTVLWLLFVNEQRVHLDQVFQFQTERVADELVRVTLQDQFPATLPDDVVGFGLYGRGGAPISRYGVVPKTLMIPPGLGRAERIFQRLEGGQVVFVKRLDRLEERMSSDDDNRPAHRVGGTVLYLGLKDDAFRSQVVIWTAGAVAGPLVWAAFLVFVGWLWHRSRQYQAALNNNRELLQFAEAARTLSHEIKNPLAAILLQTALLKRSAGGDPPQEVKLIEEEAQRINQLVSRVRDFLKDPIGQPETHDLCLVVTALLGRFAEPIQVSGNEQGPFRVSFDPHRLRSVLENLLRNAIESGSETPTEVRLSRPKSGWNRLEVLDRGAGFTETSLKQASTPFFTTKTQGSGIGLSITESFVNAAGGSLKWENRSEGGARVWIDLPESKEAS
jgi:signal transduction histidine kinase